MKVRKIAIKPLKESLKELLVLAQDGPLQFSKVIELLKGRGMPVFLILLTLPFSLPVSIPGLSTPFGLVIALMGIRYALGLHLWWPEWLMKKEMNNSYLEKVVSTALRWNDKAKKVLRPRWLWMTQNLWAHRLHGLFVALLGLLLALPLPIPFTNYTCSIPLLMMGFGLLEDDGLFVSLGYFTGFFTLLFWGSIILFGYEGLRIYFGS